MLVLVHYKKGVHLFTFDDEHPMHLNALQASVEARFFTDLNDFMKNSYHVLCDGPEACKPLDEEGFNRIIGSISNNRTTSNVRQVDETAVNEIHLWLRHFGKQVSILLCIIY